MFSKRISVATVLWKLLKKILFKKILILETISSKNCETHLPPLPIQCWLQFGSSCLVYDGLTWFLHAWHNMKKPCLIFLEVILFKFKCCLNRRLSLKTIYLWPKLKELNAVSQKNKQNRMLCSILHFSGKSQLLTSFTSRLAPVNTN